MAGGRGRLHPTSAQCSCVPVWAAILLGGGKGYRPHPSMHSCQKHWTLWPRGIQYKSMAGVRRRDFSCCLLFRWVISACLDH